MVEWVGKSGWKGRWNTTRNLHERGPTPGLKIGWRRLKGAGNGALKKGLEKGLEGAWEGGKKGTWKGLARALEKVLRRGWKEPGWGLERGWKRGWSWNRTARGLPSSNRLRWKKESHGCWKKESNGLTYSGEASSIKINYL